MIRVAVSPDLLRWARDRAGLLVEDLTGRFPKLAAWERGELSPTFNPASARQRREAPKAPAAVATNG